jgi:hypothetical protein
MPTYRVRLISRWNTAQARRRMQAPLDHPTPGVAWTDVTGQPDPNIPPAPNALTLEAFPVDDALLSALEADAAVEILWAEAE